jgi:hypothetical protein
MQSYHLHVGQLEFHCFSFYFWSKHVYVQVVVIMAHIFPWFYIQERLKRPLWVEDKLPI